MADQNAADNGTAPQGGSIAQVADRYLVDPSRPLPEMSTPSAQAFAADDRKDPGRQIFGMVCNPTLPVRSNAMRALRGVQNPGLMQLLEFDVAYWPPIQRQALIVIYDRPTGGKVLESMTPDQDVLPEAVMLEAAIKPLLNGLRELSTRGVTHRAIRPTNIFWANNKRDRMVLGDGVCAPAAVDQPVLCETIEMHMCRPDLRGAGQFNNDLYAFGMSLLLIHLGRNPVEDYTSEQLLYGKITKGTYATVGADLRLPLSLMEVIRGLLSDDDKERWDLESCELWQGGRRLSPLQTKLDKRAQRSFRFLGEEYFTAREIAFMLYRNWDEAKKVIADGTLETWLRRALEDKDRAELLTTAQRMIGGMASEKGAVEDLLVAAACMILDRSAPIRYKGLSLMPDGYGPGLARAMSEKKDTRPLAELIMREVPRLWFETRQDYSPEYSLYQGNFRDMRNYLQQQGMGYGLERCLYEINDTLALQSPMVGGNFVVDIRDLLPALNEVAKKADTKTRPIDRHLAAFIAARFNYDIDAQVDALRDSNDQRSLLGTVSLLALIQWRLGPESLFNLASWVGGLLGPVINSYHNRDRRKQIEREIPRLVRKGSLPEMYNMVDSAEEREKDEEGFQKAVTEYMNTQHEIRELDSSNSARLRRAERQGQQAAAVTSVVIALIAFSIMVAMRIW